MLFKKILFILFLLVSIMMGAQQASINFGISSAERSTITNQVQSNCATPNGSMNVIAAAPSNYTQLQTNGYCNPASYGKSGTVCWMLTPASNSITINSGFATSGCGGQSFSNPILYTCAPSCISQGIGTDFSVTPGSCYTWCITYNGFGGGGCSFTDFCPYWIEDGVILPIELLYFAGSNQGQFNVLQWETEIEIINNYFLIETSTDGINWSDLKQIKGAGTTTIQTKYSYAYSTFPITENYYRLKQVDMNGDYKFYGIINIDNSHMETVVITRVVNLLGQDVDQNCQGLVFVYYSNGSVIKKINN